MVKTKQIRKNNSPSHLFGSSNSVIDLDLHGDESWVVVKKQKVTILVPPLPHVQNLTTHKVQSQLQAITPEISNHQIEIHEETRLEIPSAGLPLASEKVDQQSWKASACKHNLKMEKPLRQAISLRPEKPDQICMPGSGKVYEVLDTMKSMKQPRQFHGPGSFLSGGTLLNQKFRALNLERKLQKAGGLSRWLVSLGLNQFVGLFQRISINKFQLVNLTMKKLKDMGANAVGPRRKLMHEIECVCQCQPYRSEPFEHVYGI